MRVCWTSPALYNLEAIGDYIAQDNLSAAARIVAAILDQADMLAQHPYIGRAGRAPETRELVVNHMPYILPYRVREDRVQILAALHAA